MTSGKERCPTLEYCNRLVLSTAGLYLFTRIALLYAYLRQSPGLALSLEERDVSRTEKATTSATMGPRSGNSFLI